MISSVAWIRKGASARHPTKYELTDEEFTDLASRIDLEVVDARTEYERAVALAGQEPAGDEFDEDESEESDEEMEGVEESTTTTTAAKTTTSDDNGIPDELKEYNLDNYDDEDEKGQKGKNSYFKNSNAFRDLIPNQILINNKNRHPHFQQHQRSRLLLQPLRRPLHPIRRQQRSRRRRRRTSTTRNPTHRQCPRHL